MVEDRNFRILLRIEIPVDVDLERDSAHKGQLKGLATLPEGNGKASISRKRNQPKKRSTFFMARRKISTSEWLL